MSKTARFIDGNRLQELPDMKEPLDDWPRGDNAVWEHDIVLANKAEYQKQLAACRTLPAPDCKFKVGEVYELDKDYILQYQHLVNGWTDCDEKTYNHEPERYRRIIAVPIKAESQDEFELWEQVFALYDEWPNIPNENFPEFIIRIKSKFHITRKQQ